MIKKLKNKSGAAFILAWIFWVLMLFLTEAAFEYVAEGESEVVRNFRVNEYNYFIVKSAINHYADLLNGLQYTETSLDEPFDLPSPTETYNKGEFQVVQVNADGSYSDDADRTKAFQLLVNSDDFNDAFAYFQRLRSEVTTGQVTLSTMDSTCKPAYQGFSVQFITEGLENIYYYSEPGDDDYYVITTTLTFFGESVYYNSYASFAENTARIKVDLSCNGTVVSSSSITCVPTLDNSTGFDVWTWESFN